jgi:hypothetical protein
LQKDTVGSEAGGDDIGGARVVGQEIHLTAIADATAVDDPLVAMIPVGGGDGAH